MRSAESVTHGSGALGRHGIEPVCLLVVWGAQRRPEQHFREAAFAVVWASCTNETVVEGVWMRTSVAL